MTPPPAWDPLPTCVQDLPELPPEYDAVVRAGIVELGLTDLSDMQLASLADHVRLLVAWNAAINLSGIREPVAMARAHVLDSLAAVPLLRRAGVAGFVDLGSGGGFPGLPLAVAFPTVQALLVESVAKKARFLSTAVAAIKLEGRVAVVADRAEGLAGDPNHRAWWPAVVARAVADLSQLSELALPLLAEGGILVAWKRLPMEAELAHAREAVAELGGRLMATEHVGVAGLEDHVLAVVEKVAPTPPQFPRDPAARRRKPL